MKTKLTPRTFRLFAASLLTAFPASQAGAATLLEWDASDWSGTGAWTDSANSEPLTVSAGAVTKAVDSTTFAGSGQQISSTVYDGSSGFNSDGVTPIEGLDEFTISAVIRVGATPGAGADGDGQPWRYAMITGLEIPAAGQGEFQFGFSNAQTLNGAVGFNGDQWTKGGSVAADTWATVALTVDDDGAGNFTLQTYINGVAQGTATTAAYAGAHPDIRDAIFGVGWNTVASGFDSRFFAGEIAHLRFDDTVLSSAELTADAGNYLGTLEVIPEPSSLTLLGLGGLMLLRRRRK